jgi:hypothetical protein
MAAKRCTSLHLSRSRPRTRSRSDCGLGVHPAILARQPAPPFFCAWASGWVRFAPHGQPYRSSPHANQSEYCQPETSRAEARTSLIRSGQPSCSSCEAPAPVRSSGRRARSLRRFIPRVLHRHVPFAGPYRPTCWSQKWKLSALEYRSFPNAAGDGKTPASGRSKPAPSLRTFAGRG